MYLRSFWHRTYRGRGAPSYFADAFGEHQAREVRLSQYSSESERKRRRICQFDVRFVCSFVRLVSLLQSFVEHTLRYIVLFSSVADSRQLVIDD